MKRFITVLLLALVLLTVFSIVACDDEPVVTDPPADEVQQPTPENPTPENPTPENPTPENPTPEDPTPPAPVIYQITLYDENGGWLQNVNTADGGAYTLTPPVRIGYDFVGWFSKADHTAFPESGTLTADCDVTAKYTVAETKTFAELKERAEAGAKDIYVTADITLTDTVHIVANTTISVGQNCIMTRDAAFVGDLFVVGETPAGESVVELFGYPASLTLQGTETATLTIDGNKQNVTDTVSGTAILILNSSAVNLKSGIVVQNCKKNGNDRVYGYAVSYPHKAGGAAVMVINGTLNVNGASLLNNEVQIEDAVEGDTELGISSCGGAIFNFGTVNINAGTISGNRAARGGAIYNFRDCTVKGAVIADNSAAVYGGAVYLANSQYGEFKIGAAAAAEENYAVTFRGNVAEKSGGAIFAQTKNGIIIYGSALFTENVSVTSNGGAINTSGSLTIKDAAFISNTAASKGGAVYIYCASEELTTRHVSIEKGLFESNSASKGGALACSSSSLDFTEGAIGSIGAVAFKNNTAFTTETDDPELTGEESGSVFNGKGGAIYLSRKGVLTISGATFTGNSAEDNGGAIYATGGSTLTATDTLFSDNHATGDKGGALYVTTQAQATITDCTFLANSAEKFGGAVSVHSAGTTLKLIGSIFTENEAKGSHGGALSAFSGSLVEITNCSFTKNSAFKTTYEADGTTVVSTSGKGGAIHVQSDPEATTPLITIVRVSGSSFTENQAGEHGGAINLYEGAQLYVTSTSFNTNIAESHGGALYSSGSTAEITDGEFTANYAKGRGGAIYVASSTSLTMTRATFTSNSSLDNGGALSAYSDSVLAIYGITAIGNTSVNGGALHFTGATQTDLYDIKAVDNTATKGGFMYITTTGTVVNLHSKALDTDAISGNTATGGGNLIWSNTTKCTINANFANLPELLYDEETDADGTDAMADGYTDDIGSKDNKKITIGEITNA